MKETPYRNNQETELVNEKSSLFEQSHEWRIRGEELLNSSKIPEILNKYGEIRFVGSYPSELMMNGDIDIHVLRENDFTKQEILEIFNDLFTHTNFDSSYIGDWRGKNTHTEFPDGGYIGMEKKQSNEKWKIDMWFMTYTEQDKRDQDKLNINDVPISEDQRDTILKFKKLRNERGIRMSGQKIYEMVINEGMTSADDFVKRLEQKTN